MITLREMEDLLNSGEIAVSYMFTSFEDGQDEQLPDEQAVNLANPDSPATKMFRQNFFIDRLHVTLGPVVMTHDRRYATKRKKFGGYPFCTDIRESGKRIEIEPRETISVSTNERITTKGKVSGLVFPRLKLVDSGLVYVPSYIDPHWDGILQAVIINATNSRQVLHLAERIATCFFFKVDTEVSADVVKEFQKRSHHYGQNWHKIFRHEANPFPRSKEPPQELQGVVATASLKVREWWVSWGKVIKTVGAILTFLLGTGLLVVIFKFAVSYGALQSSVNQLKAEVEKLSRTAEQHSQEVSVKFPEMSKRLDELSNRLPVSGVSTIAIPRGAKKASHRLRVKWLRGKIPTVWVSAMEHSESVASLSGTVEPSSFSKDETDLYLRVVLKEGNSLDQIRLQWLLVEQ